MDFDKLLERLRALGLQRLVEPPLDRGLGARVPRHLRVARGRLPAQRRCSRTRRRRMWRACARRSGSRPGRRAVLYAPTHREYEDGYVPMLDLARLADALGPDHVILARLHYFYDSDPLVRELHDAGRLLDVASHPSVEELCLAADVLLTDYSSIMFDYAVLDRPIVIHAPDWESYRARRGVYFDLLAEPPGAVTRTEDEVVEALRASPPDGARAPRSARASARSTTARAERVAPVVASAAVGSSSMSEQRSSSSSASAAAAPACCRGSSASSASHIPQPEVKADDTNPRGFGEPRWVVDFHSPRAARTSASRSTTRGPPPGSRWRSPRRRCTTSCASGCAASSPRPTRSSSRTRARCGSSICGAAAPTSSAPRTSFVTMLRHPAEIVASARKSYGAWLTEASRAAAWLNVMLETEHATRGAQRAFVRYDDLLADWVPRDPPPRRARSTSRAWPAIRPRARGRRVRRPDAAPQPHDVGRPRRPRAPCAISPRSRGTPRCSARRREAALDADREAYREALRARPRRSPSARSCPPRPIRRAAARRRAEAAADAARARRPPHPGAVPRSACAGSSVSRCRGSASSSRSTTSRSSSSRAWTRVLAQTFTDFEVVMVERRLDRPQRRDRRSATPTATTASGSCTRRTAASARPATPAPTRPAASCWRSSTATTCCSPNAYELLRRRARPHGLGLRHRQRLPAHPVLDRSSRRSSRQAFTRDAAEDAHHEVPAAARRPAGLEQGLAPLVLGQAQVPLPRGPHVRGHAGDDPGALPRRLGRRHLRPLLPVADPRGRRAVDHPAQDRAAVADRPPALDPGRLRAPRRRRPARLQALVRRERRRRRPALLPQRRSTSPTTSTARCSWTASTRSWTRRATRSSSRCRRSSGSSGTSCGAG